MSISSVKTGAVGTSLLTGNAFFVPPSFDSIASATGTGSSGTITFSSIPQTYKSLQIRAMARSTIGTVINVLITFNGDSAANYTRHDLNADGSIVASGGVTSGTSIFAYEAGRGASTAANIVGVSITDIHDYASTTKNKTVRIIGGSDANNTTGDVALSSGLWLSTAAIDSISFSPTSGNWTTETQFALYGIKG